VKLFARPSSDLSVTVYEKVYVVFLRFMAFGVLFKLIGVTASSCSEVFRKASELTWGLQTFT